MKEKELCNSTVLYDAVEQGDKEGVVKAINLKANVNCVDKEGMTPLLTAVAHGYADIVLALIRAGADVNKTSLSGDSAVFLAIMRSYDDIFSILLEQGADITNLWDKKSNITVETILDNPDIIRLLGYEQGL